jgi:hypothetical protein
MRLPDLTFEIAPVDDPADRRCRPSHGRGIDLHHDARNGITPVVFRVVGGGIDCCYYNRANEPAAGTTGKTRRARSIKRRHRYHALLEARLLAGHCKRARLTAIKRHTHLRWARHGCGEAGRRQRARSPSHLYLTLAGILISPHFHKLVTCIFGHTCTRSALRLVDIDPAARARPDVGNSVNRKRRSTPSETTPSNDG